MTNEDAHRRPIRTTCCPCGCGHGDATDGISRRTFLQGVGGATAFGAAISGLTWTAVSAAEMEGRTGPRRRPLVVKPVLTYATPTPRPQTSWRSWGGIQTADDAEKELRDTTMIVMDAGAEGRIIGRNFWGVSIEEGLRLSGIVAGIMQKKQYQRK